MDCRIAQQNLSAWLDRALTGDEDRQIRAHVEQCAACAGEAEALARLSSFLHRAQDEDAPSGFRSRLMTRLLQQEREKQDLYALLGMQSGGMNGIVTVRSHTDRSRAVLTYAEYTQGIQSAGDEQEAIRYDVLPPEFISGGGVYGN